MGVIFLGIFLGHGVGRSGQSTPVSSQAGIAQGVFEIYGWMAMGRAGDDDGLGGLDESLTLRYIRFRS